MREAAQTPMGILARHMYDIPLGARTGLFVAGLAGVVLIVVASLTGGKGTTIRVDKLLHFGGYATLAAIFVMSLRPVYFLPALGLLALVGLMVEYLQPFNTRTFDLSDVLANLVGLAIGAALGLVLRLVGRLFTSHVKRVRLLKQRRTYQKGAIIFRQGASVENICVIQDGQVQLVREAEGQRVILGTMSSGDVFGLLAVLQSQPQYATVEALRQTTVYSLDLKDLLPSSSEGAEPVESLLTVMSRHLRTLADRVVEVEKLMP